MAKKITTKDDTNNATNISKEEKNDVSKVAKNKNTLTKSNKKSDENVEAKKTATKSVSKLTTKVKADTDKVSITKTKVNTKPITKKVTDTKVQETKVGVIEVIEKKSPIKKESIKSNVKSDSSTKNSSAIDSFAKDSSSKILDTKNPVVKTLVDKDDSKLNPKTIEKSSSINTENINSTNNSKNPIKNSDQTQEARYNRPSHNDYRNNRENRDNRDNRDNRYVNRDNQRDNRVPSRKISNENPNFAKSTSLKDIKRYSGSTNQTVLTKYDNKRREPSPHKFKSQNIKAPINKTIDLNSPIKNMNPNDLKRLQEIEFKNKFRNDELEKENTRINDKDNYNRNKNSNVNINNKRDQNIDINLTNKNDNRNLSQNLSENQSDKNRDKLDIIVSEEIVLKLDETLLNDINLVEKADKNLDAEPTVENKLLENTSKIEDKVASIDNNPKIDIGQISESEYIQLEVNIVTNANNEVEVNLEDDIENIQRTIREVKKQTFNDKNKQRKEQGLPPIKLGNPVKKEKLEDLESKSEKITLNVTKDLTNNLTENITEASEELNIISNRNDLENLSNTKKINNKEKDLVKGSLFENETNQHNNKPNIKIIPDEKTKTNVIADNLKNINSQETEIQIIEDTNSIKNKTNQNNKLNKSINLSDKKEFESSQNNNQNQNKQNQYNKEQNSRDNINKDNANKDNVNNKDKNLNNKNNRELEKAIPKKEFIPKPTPIKKSSINLSEKELNDPFYKKVLDNTYRFLRHKLNIEEGTTILLAISGGVDSVVMLDILYNLTTRYRVGLEIAHYNHNLRGNSSIEDEIFVRNLADYYGLQYHFTNGNVKEYSEKNKTSIETSARVLRYKFFEKVVSTIKCSYLATAHNANDLAETFIYNLTRGTGLTGLAGIPIKRALTKNCNIVRPIIDLKKQEILEYAKMRNLEWREDVTNEETQYTRNKIRHVVLPILEQEFNPSIIDVINRTARLINGADRFLNRFINDNTNKVITEINENTAKININILKTYNQFIQGEIIQNILINSFNIQNITMNIIDRVTDLLRAEINSKYDIDKNFSAYRDRNDIIITNIKTAIFVDVFINRTVDAEYDLGNYIFKLTQVSNDNVDYDSENHIEYFDAEFMPQFLQLRYWKEGDSFKPLGMNGNSMKVSDLLTNEKVSVVDKKKIFVLTDKVNIIWVVGYRLSEDYKVSQKSKVILRAEIIDKKI